MAPKLNLKAADAEDLRIIAACLQDALLPARDLSWLPDQHRFIFVANRFLWEAVPGADGVHERTLAAVSFDRIDSVSFRGIDPRSGDRLLSILDVARVDDHGLNDGAIDLVFSDNVTIRLMTASIEVHLSDLVEPWPTQWRPIHSL